MQLSVLEMRREYHIYRAFIPYYTTKETWYPVGSVIVLWDGVHSLP